MKKHIPRLIIAGVSGSVGKTTVMVALAGAFRKRGLKVACFKCGPDYLDPSYHRLASGSVSHNLDCWMMGQDAVVQTLAHAGEEADIALIEGMMGLYDGLDPTSSKGSTAQLAHWLKAPVLLLADAAAMARSVSALALGFKQFDPEIYFVGMLCNFVGGQGHLNLIKRARPAIPVLGGLPRTPEHGFTERHLGLEAAQSNNTPVDTLDFWAEQAQNHVDLDSLLKAAQAAPPLEVPEPVTSAAPKYSCKIGVARDEAFSFYYPYNLNLLQENGAELVYFSPLKDRQIPEVDGLIFGGGYPELHAEALSANEGFLKDLRAFAEDRPVYGECGGLMYLQKTIVTTDGKHWPMAGLFPGKAIMQSRLQAIGYVEAVTTRDTWLGQSGTRFRGHQFRYSQLEFPENQIPETAYGVHTRKNNDAQDEGYCKGKVLGSYVHGHMASNPNIAREMVKRCS